MVSVFTNTPALNNDIAEVVRLFLDLTDIVFTDGQTAPEPNNYFLSAELTENTGKLNAAARFVYNDGTEAVDSSACFEMSIFSQSSLILKRLKKRCMKIAVFRAIKKIIPANTPWGSLTGIRPTKLLRELLEELSVDEAERIMLLDFDVSKEKYELAKKILIAQEPIVSAGKNNDIDVYIGIPFCVTRCLYCSFASQIRTSKTDIEGYLKALKKDISLGADIAGERGFRIRSIYVGGGTPTSLTCRELDELLYHTLESYGRCGAELTVEAGRPDTIDKDKLLIMKKHGVERISVNPQSMNARTLLCIGRSHTPDDIESAFKSAREAGFSVINMDIIAGLPGESPEDFQYTLDKVFELKPENLTVHTLAIKRSSELKQRLFDYPLPDASQAEIMVKQAAVTAERLSMHPYYMYRQKYMRGNLENVGYCVPGTECIYNIDMMEEIQSIMAHGAGSISKRVFSEERRIERIAAPKDIASYINKIDELSVRKKRLFSQ
ncbi:MAG: Oxygen-independent coproporphyrinogen-III oxidase 2 [Firmicutes bacterium ADurb.Bin182]|nr:MAG: Oxygen-independent coproporphyrinogen-III oxidase 2 [Firmicutes bacterium ADurb.Bin182]